MNRTKRKRSRNPALALLASKLESHGNWLRELQERVYSMMDLISKLRSEIAELRAEMRMTRKIAFLMISLLLTLIFLLLAK